MSISSTEFEPSPAYRLRPSPRLRIILLSLPVLAITGLLVTPGLPGILRLSALLMTVLVAVATWRSDWPGAGRAVQALRFEPGGRCRVRLGDGTEMPARVADTMVLPYLVILSLRDCPRRRAVVIPSDALDAESHRRLRREARAC